MKTKPTYQELEKEKVRLFESIMNSFTEFMHVIDKEYNIILINDG